MCSWAFIIEMQYNNSTKKREWAKEMSPDGNLKPQEPMKLTRNGK